MSTPLRVVETEADKFAAKVERQWSRISPGVVYCDPRVGSAEYMRVFRRLAIRSTTYDENLLAGDFAFRCGHAEASAFCKGEFGCRILVERKTVADLVSSLIKNRTGHQVPDMLRSATMAWIVVEGIWRPSGDDCIEIMRGRDWVAAPYALTYSQLNSWMTRFDVYGMGRLHRWRTSTSFETVAWIASTFRWWQKEWRKHHVENVDKMPDPIKALLWKPNKEEKMIASVPGIGIKKMKIVTRHFDNMWAVVHAEVADLRASGLNKAAAVEAYQSFRRRFRK